jgi:hypothetical protein
MSDWFSESHSNERREPDWYIPEMKQVLGGLAVVAMIGTVSYSLWIGAPGRLLAHLHVSIFYFPPLYSGLYLLVQTEKTDTLALADRICATLTAIGVLVVWGWYVTVPLTPQNAQAPIGLFMLGGIGAAAFYGGSKIVIHEYRRTYKR